MQAQTLIVTLKFDEGTASFFNEKRRVHYPSHINYLQAHCTLFHKLPDRPEIFEVLAKASVVPSFEVIASGLKSIGKGVVYNLSGPFLSNYHSKLQSELAPWLISQDRQSIRPHVTIQNKVTAFKASELLKELQATFKPFSFRGVGISVWHYLNGPWCHITDFHFKTNQE